MAWSIFFTKPKLAVNRATFMFFVVEDFVSDMRIASKKNWGHNYEKTLVALLKTSLTALTNSAMFCERGVKHASRFKI